MRAWRAGEHDRRRHCATSLSSHEVGPPAGHTSSWAMMRLVASGSSPSQCGGSRGEKAPSTRSMSSLVWLQRQQHTSKGVEARASGRRLHMDGLDRALLGERGEVADERQSIGCRPAVEEVGAAQLDAEYLAHVRAGEPEAIGLGVDALEDES